MHSKQFFFPAAIALAFGALTPIAHAIGGATSGTPATTFNIDSCREIAQPGIYKLTTNLNGKSYDGTACFRIKAPNVTLDLGGHTVRGTNGSPSYGIIADGGATLGVGIINGMVADFGVGIWLGNTFAAVVQDISVNVNKVVGLVAGNGAVLRRVQARSNNHDGIQTGAGAYVDGAYIEANGSDGLTVGVGSMVINSSSEFNRRGIVVDRTRLGRNIITGNTTGANTGVGISVDCIGGVPQSGGGVFSGLWVKGNTRDPFFPNGGHDIIANAPDIYTMFSSGAALAPEPCQVLQPGTVIHRSGDSSVNDTVQK